MTEARRLGTDEQTSHPTQGHWNSCGARSRYVKPWLKRTGRTIKSFRDISLLESFSSLRSVHGFVEEPRNWCMHDRHTVYRAIYPLEMERGILPLDLSVDVFDETIVRFQLAYQSAPGIISEYTREEAPTGVDQINTLLEREVHQPLGGKETCNETLFRQLEDDDDQLEEREWRWIDADYGNTVRHYLRRGIAPVREDTVRLSYVSSEWFLAIGG